MLGTLRESMAQGCSLRAETACRCSAWSSCGRRGDALGRRFWVAQTRKAHGAFRPLPFVLSSREALQGSNAGAQVPESFPPRQGPLAGTLTSVTYCRRPAWKPRAFASRPAGVDGLRTALDE